MASCNFCKVDPKGKEKLKSCVCGKASYCSKDCQAKDWKSHRPSCPPYEIRESPGKGRGFFATRRIKEGQLILEEYPLLVLELGPSLSEFETHVYPNMDEETKAKILQLFDPAESFSNLDSKTSEELFRKNPKMSFYKEALSASDEINKIWRIFFHNNLQTCGEPTLYSNFAEMGLYNFSLLNHACVPNVVQSWVIGDYRRRQLRALMNIEKDEEILTAYIPTQEFVYGTRDFRRQQLWETSAFNCQCSECSLEGEDLEENERIRAEIREKEARIGQLINCGRIPERKSTKKAMRLSNQRMELIKKLNIRALFVTEMLEFYVAATNAKILGINAPDPVIFKDEARKYAKMFGDCFIHDCNTFLNNYGL